MSDQPVGQSLLEHPAACATASNETSSSITESQTAETHRRHVKIRHTLQCKLLFAIQCMQKQEGSFDIREDKRVGGR